jgi:hypothetical protein
MALLLGAFMIHGLVPGPRMLTENLDVTYSMVWSIALANILGAGLCFAFSGQFAKLATLRYTLILPGVMSIMYVGAFQGSRDWGDLYVLLIFGVIGWIMKRLGWPRPPLILGFVLGAIIEQYMFISMSRYGWEWVMRPIVAVLLLMALLGLLRPLVSEFKTLRRQEGGFALGRPVPALPDLLPVGLIVLVGIMMLVAQGWVADARIAPSIIGWTTLVFCTVSLAYGMMNRGRSGAKKRGVHMDLRSDTGDLPMPTVVFRAVAFFSWLVGFMASMATIGLVPTSGLFVIAYMRIENRENWRLVLTYAVSIMVFVTIVFDYFLSIPWPDTLISDVFPWLSVIPSV